MALKKIVAGFLLTVVVLLSSLWAGSLATAQQGTSESNPTIPGAIPAIKDVEHRFATLAEVTLYVEIPSQRLNFRHHLDVLPGSTVSQVLESAYAIKHGVVCCDSRDIWAINGLAVDPYSEKWWIIKVNGNRQNSSSQTKVYDGSIIELIYEERGFYPPSHVRLEDWVKK